MHEAISCLLLLGISLLALWVMLRPLAAFTAPALPIAKLVLGGLLGLLVLVLTGLLVGTKALWELCRRG